MRPITFAVLCAIGVQPLIVCAQSTLPIAVDRGAPGAHPFVSVSGSGVPLVNIVAPNQHGVSVNNFKQYGVGRAGAVLVNSGAAAQSRIAGWVQGNPFLGNGHAAVIVNQVRSGQPTQLLGTTEIAGHRANLIIANPAGISCSGCGFIGAPRVSLTTGLPSLNADGSVAGFDVSRGSIGIAGAGLDAHGSAIDLIARAMIVNGKLWADSISGVTGVNEVPYIEGEATGRPASTSSEAPPLFAIDVQALGGMYANSVHLLGTEAGVGVRDAGQLTSLTGEIEISSRGDVTIAPQGRLQAAGRAQIDGAAIANHGSIVGTAKIELNAANTVTNSGTLISADTLAINTGRLNNSGLLAAGVDKQGKHVARAGAVILAGEVANSGTLAAGGDIHIAGRSLVFDGGRLIAGSNVDLHADDTVSNVGGEIGGSSILVRATGAFINDDGVLNSEGIAQIHARTVSNKDGSVGGQNLVIEANDAFENQRGIASGVGDTKIAATNIVNEAGKIGASGGRLRINAARALTNAEGEISSRDGLRIDAGSISNSAGRIGTVAGDAVLQIEQKLNNDAGKLVSAGALSLSASELLNRDGTIGAQNLLATAREGTLDNTDGTIVIERHAEIRAGKIVNDHAQLTSGDGLSLTGRGLSNVDGQIAASQAIDIDSGAVDNRGGTISAHGRLTVDTHGQRLDNGRLSEKPNAIAVPSANDVAAPRDAAQLRRPVEASVAPMSPTWFEAAAGSLAGDGIRIDSGELDNRGGRIGSSATLRADVASWANDGGATVSQGALRVDSSSAITNQGGQLGSNLDVALYAGTIDNDGGGMHAGGVMSMNSDFITNKQTNQRSVPSGADDAIASGIEGSSVDLRASRLFDNSSGSVRANGELSVKAPQLDNYDGSVESTGLVQLDATDIMNSRGYLNGGKSLDVIAHAMTGDGELESLNNIRVDLKSDFRNIGSMKAGGDLIVQSSGALENLGELSSHGKTVVDAGGIINRTAGKILGNAAVSVTGRQSFLNEGLIDSGMTFVTSDRDVVNKGRIYGDAIAVKARQVSNEDAADGTGGVIASRGDLDMGADIVINRGHALTYAANDIRIGKTLDANRHATGSADSVLNSGAEINAGHDIRIDSNRTDNRNAHFTTKSVTVDSGRQIWHRLNGSTEKIDPSTVFLYQIHNHHWVPGSQIEWLDDDDHQVMVRPSDRYKFEDVAQFTANGVVGPIATSRYWPGAIFTDFRPAHQRYVDRFKPDNPIWAYFGISPPAQLPDGPPLGDCVASLNPSCKPIAAWVEANQASYGALDVAISAYNRDFNSRLVKEWTIYDVSTRTTTDMVVSSDPARIIAGNAIDIRTTSGVNDKSQIVGGGPVSLSGMTDNARAFGNQIVDASGKAIYTYVASRTFKGDERRYHRKPYHPAPVVTTIELPVFTSVPGISAPLKTVVSDVGDPQRVVVKPIPSDSTAPPDAERLLPIAEHADLGQVVARTVQPYPVLPNNALYKVINDPGSHVLVQTDPRFTHFGAWLSSETMLERLGVAPAAVSKRIGDGFYEQQLLQQQIMAATGHRFIGDYTDNQRQYEALINNAVSAAKRFDLHIGLALTEAQMAALTSDMVWLVSQSVTLADGSKQDVLVPQVYLRGHAADVTGTGTIIAGKNVMIDEPGDFTNSGTIASKQLTIIKANNIFNEGTLAASRVVASATRDLNNIGGNIRGDRILLDAGHNINLTTTTQSTEATNGDATRIDKVASINAGALQIEAAHDLNANAAAITVRGDAALVAGNDVNLNAVRERSSDSIKWRYQNQSTNTVSADMGTALLADGHIAITAGHDVKANAAYASAAGNVDVTAGHDISLVAGDRRASAIDEHQKSGRGFLSSKSTHTRDASAFAEAIATTISGDAVQITAGNDVTISGSTVVATHSVNVAAANNLDINTTSTYDDQSHWQEVHQSGLGATVGGISYGHSKQKDRSRDVTASVQGSLVGSTDGEIHMHAGKTLHITGSDVLAAGNISGVGADVIIDAAKANRHHDETHETSTSGFSIGLSAGAGGALQGAVTQARAAGDSQDSRAAALHAFAAANNLVDAAGAVGHGVPDIKAQFGWGSSRSKSTFVEDRSSITGTNVAAGGKAVFVATGNGASGNIIIEGSDVSGNDILLSAKNRVDLLNGVETDIRRSTNRSQDASIGFSYGTQGLGASASMNQVHGNANSNAVKRRNTHVDARHNVTIASGGDTNLVGAVVRGRHISADVGGNLNIASAQDTRRSAARQQSVGGGFELSQAGGSATVAISGGHGQSQFNGVAEQSGIQAGDGGFDISVRGNTDLQGAYIASTADASQNALRTGTLSFSDMENRSTHEAQSAGVSVSTSIAGDALTRGNGAGRNGGGISPMLSQDDSGSQRATTQSAISTGAIEITDKANQKQDLASLNRDVSNLNGTVSDAADLNQLLDKQADMMAAAGAAGQALATRIGQYADVRKAQATDPAEAAKWDEGGDYRVAMHAAGGAVLAGLGGGSAIGGAAGAGVSAEMAGKLNELSNRFQGATGDPNADSALGEIVGNALASVAGFAAGGTSGAFAGANGDAFNRQLHPTERKWIEDHAAFYARQHDLTVDQAMDEVTAQAHRQVQNGSIGLWDSSAGAFLDNARGLLPAEAGTGTGYMFYATPDQKAAVNMYAQYYHPNAQLNQPLESDIASSIEREHAYRGGYARATIEAAALAAGLAVMGPVAALPGAPIFGSTGALGLGAWVSSPGISAISAGISAGSQYLQTGAIQPVNVAIALISGAVGQYGGFGWNVLINSAGGAMGVAFNNVADGKNDSVFVGGALSGGSSALGYGIAKPLKAAFLRFSRPTINKYSKWSDVGRWSRPSGINLFGPNYWPSLGSSVSGGIGGEASASFIHAVKNQVEEKE